MRGEIENERLLGAYISVQKLIAEWPTRRSWNAEREAYLELSYDACLFVHGTLPDLDEAQHGNGNAPVV